MGDVKKWNVTYTKHIKQKRKIYQDGFLELHSSTHKVLLFDDCEKLLESRFVKKDDVVRSGETLAFEAYLVDIGDPLGDHKPISNLNLQGRDKKTSDRTGHLHGQKFRNNPISIEDKKAYSGKNKGTSSSLSPLHKIIREFKKSEINKYGASPRCPDTVQTSMPEWQVLYTTQITQKSKKYRDGFLRLVTCGSQGRQVMLYDATRTLLDSRFLKSDEIISSGESLKFDGHLVDIGETEGDHKPPMIDLNSQQRNCIMLGQLVQAPNNSPGEWDAMYTSQITQKSKKYHHGILRLALSGSYQKQVTLLTKDGTVLSRKFLKLSEDVIAGSAFELPNYLVEVGELRMRHEGETQKNAVGKTHKSSASIKHMVSNNISYRAENTKLTRTVSTNKPLRDAHEILSILKKPMIQDGIVNMEGASPEECIHVSQSSSFVCSDSQNQVEGQPVPGICSKRIALEDYDEGTIPRCNYSGDTSKSKAGDLSIEITKLADSDHRGDSHSKILTSSGFSLGSGGSNISGPMDDVVCVKSEDQPPTAPVLLHDRSNGTTENADSPDLMTSKATSSFSSRQLSNAVKPENFSQPWVENMGIDAICHEANDPCDIEKKISEVRMGTRKMEEFPSFDLGF